ncbi:MAG TPA: ATP-dependent DNA helicase RecG [Solirubrobacterales bacterium]
MSESAAQAATEPRGETKARAAEEPPRAFGSGEATSREQLLAAPLRWPRPASLAASLQTLAGIGPKLSVAAGEAGVETLGDLLLRVPHGYRDRTELRQLDDLKIGEEATVQVEVRSARLRPTRRRGLTIVEAKVADDSATVSATWFNQAWLAEKLTPGTPLLLRGQLDRRGFRVSEYEFLDGDKGRDSVFGARHSRTENREPRFGGRPPPGLHTMGLVAVHPATEKLRAQRLREWVWQAAGLAGDAIEPLPAELRARRELAGVADALVAVHFPADAEQVETARRRLCFEELVLYQAALATRRRQRRSVRRGPDLGEPGELATGWIESLPFDLTADQRRALEEIDVDLDSGEPMQRLLMGEVGSGKTVVAVYAMLRALEAGYQGALMAPTETLAEQHAATLDRLLAARALPFALITGATGAARRREALGQLASGELGLVVGTHALIEPDVEFARLGVCVVDEQHRFGVRQRAALDARGPDGAAPHTLHMTATPIPRTLSLTAYGDLDSTVLRELPAGRRPVKTWLVEEDKRAGAYEFIRERLREGRQAFVVCPLVSESEKLQARAAGEEAKRLAAGEFDAFEVDLLHGQMPSARKAEAMQRFVGGGTDVLVATSVIEVGIDVPNATVMLVEGAERYGVSQLHQLRGRVGRGEHESFCILFADQAGELARSRLEAVAAERDGFALAEVDLALRGEGEILGTRQHGLPRFSVASLPEDMPALLAARQEVLELIRRHGSLEAPQLGPLMDAARDRFGDEAVEPIPP